MSESIYLDFRDHPGLKVAQARYKLQWHQKWLERRRCAGLSTKKLEQKAREAKQELRAARKSEHVEARILRPTGRSEGGRPKARPARGTKRSTRGSPDDDPGEPEPAGRGRDVDNFAGALRPAKGGGPSSPAGLDAPRGRLVICGRAGARPEGGDG